MGQSTDGCIAYGVVFEDGYEFPWDAEPFNGDLEEWWRVEQGFDASKGYPAEGWLDYQKQFDAAHPLPAQVENYCSGNYPMWLLAVPSSRRSASRGEPEKLDALPDVTEAEKTALREFCAKYQLTPEKAEGWYLYSYWG
jgi:hypothetical protein